MSILNVEHLTHGFGDRAIFNDVSFRLLKGEHIGLVGANGEGKSTFMSIVTGKMMPDEGKVEWAKNVNVGYLDQHAVLEAGMTIQDALKSAFDPLLQKEERMNEICDLLGSADEKEMELLMEELGLIQDDLTLHDFYTIDAKVEEVARALGLLDLGLDRDVTDLSGNVTVHEMNHYVDFLKNKSPHADANSNMFYKMSEDMGGVRIDDDDLYYSRPTEQKAYMNQLREYMFENGDIARRGDRVSKDLL